MNQIAAKERKVYIHVWKVYILLHRIPCPRHFVGYQELHTCCRFSSIRMPFHWNALKLVAAASDIAIFQKKLAEYSKMTYLLCCYWPWYSFICKFDRKCFKLGVIRCNV